MLKSRIVARGFTLIELLVVVAIIALLISILLPTLSRAREQSRISVCLSNMRSLGTAALNYYIDQGDVVFTWPGDYDDVDAGIHNPGQVLTEFIWSGDVPDATLEDWDPSQGDVPISFAVNRHAITDVLKFPPDRRPMNRYIDPDLSWSDPQRYWRGNDQPARTERPSLAPAVFHCPSDKTIAVPMAGAEDPPYDGDTPYMTWKNWGSSYPINWYWGYFYTTAHNQGTNGIIKYIAGNSWSGRGEGHNLLRSKEAHGASEFILLYENQMNFAMENAWVRNADGSPAHERTRELIGWHKQPDYHTAAFFDGHAEYRHFDTRFVDGPGWTTWPNRDEFEKYDAWKDYANN